MDADIKELMQRTTKNEVEILVLKEKIEDMLRKSDKFFEGYGEDRKKIDNIEKNIAGKTAFFRGAVWAWSIPLAFLLTLLVEKIKLIGNWLFT